MGSKVKIADVDDAFGAANTMSISDLFGKNPKKKTHKAVDLPSDIIQKRPRLSSVAMAAPTRLAFASMVSPEAFSPQ
jgi:hypothetical protein